MKSIKTSLAGFILFVLATSGLFLTCEIGLGDSVDTKPPTVTVDAPAVDSVLANTFTASGSAADETALKSVVMEFSETTSGTRYGPFNAAINGAANSWSIVLNNLKEDKAFEIADGKYAITITATDAANRTSMATTVWQIDNTKPTVLATSPLTYGSSGGIEIRTSFYKTIDIKGEAYDASTLQGIVVNLVSADGIVLDSTTADGTNTWSARFNYSASRPATILDDKVYGYNVIATDAAGNKNSYFFHRSDVYSKLDSSSGYVIFPSMYQFGQLDQGVIPATDQGLSKAVLATLRHGAQATISQAYPDFRFMDSDSPNVDWLNLNEDGTAAIGVGVPVVGSIMPPLDGSAIDQSKVSFTVRKEGLYADVKQTDVTLSSVGSSLNFEVQPRDAAGEKLETGNYIITLNYYIGTKPVSIPVRFGISSGTPNFYDCDPATKARTARSEFSQSRDIREDTVIEGYVFASDDATPANLTYTLDNGASVSVSVDGATGFYSIPVTVDESGHATDGSDTYVLTGEYGKMTAMISRTVNIDTKRPDVEVNMTPSDGDTATYNGDVTVKASITDDSALKSVYWQVGSDVSLPAYDAAAARNSADESDVGSGWHKVPVNLNNLNAPWVSISVGTAGDATARLWILACDKYGNVSAGDNAATPGANLSFTVNQINDRPKIKLSNLTVGAGHLSNNVGNTLVISGTISDDDNVRSDTVLIGIAKDADQKGDPDTPFAYSPVSGKPISDGKLISFTQDLGSAGKNLAEGYYVASIRAADANYGGTIGTESDTGLFSWSDTGIVKFVVDKNPPVVTIDQAQGQYLSGTFTLSGTATDAIGIKGGKITVGGSDCTVDAIDHTWTVSFNAAAMGEGDHTIAISATDLAGQVTNTTFRFTKDTVKPTVGVDFDVEVILKEWLVVKNVLVWGTVSDVSSGVLSVEYSTDSTTGEDGTWTALTVTGEKWSGFITFAESKTNKLYIRAMDNAKNIQVIDTDPIPTAAGVQPYTVKVDTTIPALTETAVSAVESPKAYNSDIIFKGTLDGGLSGLPENMTLRYSLNGAAQTEKTVPVTSFTGAGYTFAVDTGTTHPQDGSYEFTLEALDGAGNKSAISYGVTVETKKPVVTMNMTPSDSASKKYNGKIPVKASITDDNTIKSLYWAVTSSTTPPVYDSAQVKKNADEVAVGAEWKHITEGPLNSLDKTWDSSSAGTTAAENRYVWVMACDRFGNISIGDNAATPLPNETLSVDQSTDIPVVTFTNYEPGSYVGELTLKGTVSDDDGVVTSVSATIDGATVLDASVGNSFSVPMGSQSTKSLLMTVKDKNNKEFTFDGSTMLKINKAGVAVSQKEALVVIVDTEDPDLVISTAQNQWMPESFTLRGTAADEFGIDGDVTIIGDGVTVSGLTMGASWSATVTSSGEGTGKSLSVSAKDKNGRTRTVTYQYNYDKTKPSVVLETDLSGWQKTSTFAISGTMDDAGGSKIKSVEYSSNGTDWNTLTMSSGAIWSGNVTYADSSTNKLYVRATDNANNVSTTFTNWSGIAVSAGVTVKVDTTKPALIVSMQASGLITNNAVILKGTVTETNLMYVTLSINGTSYPTTDPVADIKTAFIAEAGYTIPLAALDNATNTLLVTARDEAGNTDSKTISVVKDIAAPTFSFSSINSNGMTVVTDSNPAVMGSVADDNGVFSVDSYIEKWDGSAWAVMQGWTQLGDPSNAKNYNWTKDLTGEPFNSVEGRYRITLRASDITSTVSPSSRNATNETIGGSGSVVFKIDRTAPVLAITAPLVNSFQGSMFTVKGTSADENNVTSVRVKVDSNDFASGTIVPATTPGGRVIITDSSKGVFIAANHGLLKDQLVFVYSVDMPSGFTAWTPYYVSSAGLTMDQFKLSATKGEAPVLFTTNGSDLKLALYDGIEWNASLTPTGLTSGAHTFYVESRDGSGKTTTQSQVFYFDSTKPSVGFINPTDSSTVYGTITLRGVASDDIALASVQLHIGKQKAKQSIPEANKYNWSYQLDTASLCNTTNATETAAGSGIWKLDVDAVATDTAGNMNTANLSFFIDNDQDRPKINIVTPMTGDIIGGTFTVKGYATDNERVMGAEMQVEIEGANYVNDTFDFWNWKADQKASAYSIAVASIISGQPYKIASKGSTGFAAAFGAANDEVGTVFIASRNGTSSDGTGTVNDVYYEGSATVPTIRAKDGTTDGMFEDRSKWYRVTGTNSWEFDLNRIGEFYKTYIASCDGSTGNAPTGRLIVKVRAFDTKSTGTPYVRGVTGNPQTVALTLNEDIPSITGVTPSNNSKVRGQFTLHAAIYAPGTMGKLEVSLNGGASYTDISSITAVVKKPDEKNWTMDYPINTAGTNAAMSIRIRATDASVNKFASISYLSVEADNRYPDNGGTAIPKAALGTEYVVQGEARDTGTIGGVGRIELYVTDTDLTKIYQLKSSAGSTGVHTAVNLADGEKTIYPNDPKTDDFFYPNSDDNYRIVIDRDEASVSADMDGYYETLQLSGGVYSWSTKFNSKLLADGKYLLHYVIFDQAGNGTHYEKQILVQNNRPTINSVDLATDLDGDTDTTMSGESMDFTSFGDTGFYVHGNWLKFTTTASSGNGMLHYAVNRLQGIIPASSMIAGNLYRIKTVGNTPFNTVGADSNTVGVTFVATGPCSTGSGDAYLVSETVVSSGNFVSGQTYYIKTTSESAVLTEIGAYANKVGIYFTATGMGDVDASATAFLIPNFLYKNEQTLSDFSGMTTEDAVNGTYFALRVWDSTGLDVASVDAFNDKYPTGIIQGEDSLETSVVMHVTLDNEDGKIPQISVADIGKRYSSTGTTWDTRTLGDVASYDDNILWTDANSNKIRDASEPREGHVEYAADSKFDNNDADVSGIIKIRGKVQDNQRIDKITVSFNEDYDLDGTGSDTAIAANTEINLATFGSGSLSAVTDRAKAVDYSSNALGFSVDDKNTPEQSNTNGHVVNFTMTWNTAFIASVADKNVTLTLRAYDAASISSTAPKQTLQVDVVPYITNVTTAVSGLLNNDLTRSSSGKYSVKTGEKIKITGFNLNPTNTGVGAGTSDVRLTGFANRDSIEKTGRGVSYTASTLGYTTVEAMVSLVETDSSIGSGYLNVFTNTIPSINSLDGRNNTEDNFVSTSGTDERWLTIWELTTLNSLGASKAKYAVYPSMAMNGDKPAFSYVYNKEGYGGAYYWNGTSENYVYELWDLFTFTSLALNSDKSYCSLLDVNLAQSGTDPRPSDKGGIIASVFYTPPKNSGIFSGEFRDYHIWLDNLAKTGTNAVLDRYAYPDIYVTGNDATTVVYYSAYDSIDNKVIVRSFKVGTDLAGVGSANKITDNTVDGTLDTQSVYTNIPQYNQNGEFPKYVDGKTEYYDYEARKTQYNGRISLSPQNSNSGKSPTGAYSFPSSGSGAGQWSAIAATSGNVALLVWYDTDSNELKYTYNTEASVSGEGTWQSEKVLDTLCAGEFVDMKVDSDDAIHIAYSDGSRLKYVYLNKYDSTAPGFSVSGPYVVDSYLGVGDKCSLSVDSSNVPFISYKGLAKTAKIAWLIGTRGDGVDSNSKFTGKWEVQVLPTSITENDSNRYLVGNRSSDKNPVVGYTNNGIEYIRRLGDL